MPYYMRSNVSYWLLETSYTQGILPGLIKEWDLGCRSNPEYATLSELVHDVPFIDWEQPRPRHCFVNSDLLGTYSLNGSILVDRVDRGYAVTLMPLAKANYALWKAGKHRAFSLMFAFSVYTCSHECLTARELAQELAQELNKH